MDRTPDVHPLERVPIHLGERQEVVPIIDFNDDYDRYIERYCPAGAPGRLVMWAHSATDWPAWECHPAGPEVVIAIAGKAEMIQRFPDGERRVLIGPGQALINPPGVPHTARIIEPFTAIYITPCPDTFHEPR